MEGLPDKIKEFVEKNWKDSVLDSLKEFIKIPNMTPDYDPEWETNGLADKAAKHIVDWVKAQGLKNLTIDILKDPDHTPTILAEIPANGVEKTVLLYAHYDKQPPLDQKLWDEGLGPYTPVEKDGRLYGRGASDDGYGPYACMLPIKFLQENNMPYPRCVILFEGAEESASRDLPYYLEKIKDKIGEPDCIFCMDSGAGDYEHMWLTSSLRGVCNVYMKVTHLREGVHSGDAGGIVPDTFRICRMLLDRLEDPKTGEVIEALQCPLSESYKKKIYDAAEIIGKDIYEAYPFLEGTLPQGSKEDLGMLAVNRCWKAQMCITGAEGLPDLKDAGNVLRPSTTLKVSIRLPPAMDTKKAKETVEKILTTDVPLGAKVELSHWHVGSGWECPEQSAVLAKSLEEASKAFYGKPALFYGEGGAIGFMKMLANKYPKAEFLVSGVLGPYTNPHGPNEMLPIEYTKKMMMCLCKVLAEYKQATQLFEAKARQ